MSVWRQRLESRGALRLGTPATGVIAASHLGAARFLVAHEGGCFLLDASEPSRPLVAASWEIAGMTGAVITRGLLLAFGPGGLFAIHGAAGAATRVERLGREPVLAASSDGDRICVALADRVDLLNAYGGVTGRIPTEEPPVGLQAANGQVLVSSTSRMVVASTDDGGEPRTDEEIEGLGGLRLVRSGLDGRVFGVSPDGSAAELESTERGWTTTVVHHRRPWSVAAALSGTTVAHLGDQRRIDLFRSQSPPRLVSPEQPT